MGEPGNRERSLKSQDEVRGGSLSDSRDSLVRQEPLVSGRSLPWLIQPTMEGLSLTDWAAENREQIRHKTLEHGGVLFRGFKEKSIEDFQRFLAGLGLELLEYKERSSPRHTVGQRVYTSTDYPAEYEIYLHNENSYQHTWPTKIFFFCVDAAEEGGATPIADCRKIYQRLDPALRQRFIDKQWMAVRNYGDGFGLPWQTVYQTEDKAEVERHCREHGVRFEWKSDERLRTRAVRPAVVRHPETGEMSWFNHATFFHVTTLHPSVREVLLSEFDSQEDLPNNSFYGDGSPIEPETLDQLRAAYRAETVSFPWQPGDLLMLDNVLVAHGREAFSGSRKITVAMAEPRSWEDVA